MEKTGENNENFSTTGRKTHTTQPKILILDLSGTLSKKSIGLELLAHKIGRTNAIQEYSKLRKPGIKLTEAILRGIKLLARHQTTVEDYHYTTDKIVKKGELRGELLELARYLQKRGTKVILTNKTSQIIAERIANQYGLNGAIGTKEKIENGRITGVEEILSEKEGTYKGIKTNTKINRIKEIAPEIDSKDIAVITDSIDDLETIKEAGFSILYSPLHKATHQEIAEKLGLGDYIVHEGATPEENLKLLYRLKLLLRHPGFASQPERLEAAVERLHKLNLTRF
ncbi:HAD family hydrolase [Candidatus Micrarchaeota archaeon]|nr:HAD family hydrolase [Candidatus Micrarchaeota archaeon]